MQFVCQSCHNDINEKPYICGDVLMKKSLLAIFLSFLAIGSLESRVRMPKIQQRRTVTAGETFNVVLPHKKGDNKWKWTFESSRFSYRPYVTLHENGDNGVFKFTAMRPGKTALTFSYSHVDRPWWSRIIRGDDSNNSRVYVYPVRVKEEK